MKFAATDCIGIIGRRGCGKSHLGKKLQQMWPRRVILDPTFEYTDATGRPIFPGAIVVHNFFEFGKKIIELKNSKKFVLIFQPGIELEDFRAEFDQICRVIFYFGDVQIVLEELQEYASPHQLPAWLKKLMLVGRHQKISVLWTSQRPGEINKTVLSQCVHLFCGSIFEGNDLRYIANFLDEDSKKLKNLADREFFWFTQNNIKKIRNDFSA